MNYSCIITNVFLCCIMNVEFTISKWPPIFKMVAAKLPEISVFQEKSVHFRLLVTHVKMSISAYCSHVCSCVISIEQCWKHNQGTLLTPLLYNSAWGSASAFSVLAVVVVANACSCAYSLDGSILHKCPKCYLIYPTYISTRILVISCRVVLVR